MTDTIATAETTKIYDDRYVTLTNDALILKVYYFPLCGSKTIPLEDIDTIQVGTDPALGLESFWKKKTWGIALSDVWWAFRAGREFRSDNETNFVASLKGDESSVRSGFSVEDPETFGPLIDKYIPKKTDRQN